MQEIFDHWLTNGWVAFGNWMNHPSSWVLLFSSPIVFCLFMRELTSLRCWHNFFHDAKWSPDCRICWRERCQRVYVYPWTS